MAFEGEFETHITVNLRDFTQSDTLAQWCKEHGFKWVHIVLERGRTPSQPMFTFHGTGTLETERHKANALCRECEALGFQVSRVKLEVPPWSPGVPQTQEDALNQPSQQYFEHHIKLLLPPDADVPALTEAVVPHGAHLSRNARRLRADGQQERFVTQRCSGVSRAQAHARLQHLQQALAPFGYPVLETEEEFVVFDSNLALDTGWLSA